MPTLMQSQYIKGKTTLKENDCSKRSLEAKNRISAKVLHRAGAHVVVTGSNRYRRRMT